MFILKSTYLDSIKVKTMASDVMITTVNGDLMKHVLLI